MIKSQYSYRGKGGTVFTLYMKLLPESIQLAQIELQEQRN